MKTLIACALLTVAAAGRPTYEVSCTRPDCTNRFVGKPLKSDTRVTGGSISNTWWTTTLEFKCPKCHKNFTECTQQTVPKQPVVEIKP